MIVNKCMGLMCKGEIKGKLRGGSRPIAAIGILSVFVSL